MMDEHSAWKDVDGDHTYALHWKIGKHSRVWEIGGFEGRWAAQMVEKYDPYVDIFEPQAWAVEKLRTRFDGNSKVNIYPWGLWVMDASLPVYHYETDGASLLNDGVRSQIVAFKDFWTQLDVNVDVCLMNIEGAEFVLIPYLLGYDLMKHFRYFWCQFHTFVPGSEDKIRSIYKGMEKTHKILWDFFPTAVAWERLE